MVGRKQEYYSLVWLVSVLPGLDKKDQKSRFENGLLK